MKTLPPVFANEGIVAMYRKWLDTMIGQMHNSVVHWVSAQYRTNPPLAQDASPAMDLRKVLEELSRRWQAEFNDLAPIIAKKLADKWQKQTTSSFKNNVKSKVGMSVQFRMTREMNDILQATVGENISLIKSIPSQYFTQVEGAVLRAAAEGRDLKTVLDIIGPKVDLTRIRMGRKPRESDRSYIARVRRRAAFIARDQANKATSYMHTARQLELGITEATWMHSGAGKHPRPEHVAFSGQTYDIKKGAYLEGRWTWPGVEPNCRCTSRPKLPWA